MCIEILSLVCGLFIYFFIFYLAYGLFCGVEIFIYFFGVLGLRCRARAFSSCGERGLLFAVVRGLLIVVASLVAEHEP